MILTIVQIAILLILPLVYIRSRCENKMKYLVFIIIVYATWYLTYSFAHELFHLATAKLLNEKVLHFQLVPKFWKGQSSGGYVKTLYTSKSKEFFIVFAPYLRDITFAIIGNFVIMRFKNNIYICSTIFLFLICSSLFDVINNYFAYVLGALNDFNALGYTTQKFVPHLIGILFILGIGILFYLSFRSILKNDPSYPFKE